ncbi:hypothetical protein HZC07_01900 [Candidatus Micrarchaeota archaeon]|nr:hypothetical protein [Candidatus Micrarchaeota archaeon]
MAKNKGLLSKLLSFSIDGIKFLLNATFSIAKWIAKLLYVGILLLIGKAAEEAKKKVIQSKKPSVKANYSEFEIVKTVNGSFDDFEKKLT